MPGLFSEITLLSMLLMICHLPLGVAAFSLQSRRQTLDQFVDQYYAAYSREDLDMLASFYADDVSFEDPTFDLIFNGKTQLLRMMKQSKPRYSDIKWKIENRVIGEHQVAIDGTFSTRINAKTISGVRFATFLTFRAGKIIRHIDFFDRAALEKQLNAR